MRCIFCLPRIMTTFLIIIIAAASVVFAEVKTSQQDGPWSDPTTWANGVPADDDAVIINHHVTISADQTAVIGPSLTGNDPPLAAVSVAASGALTLGNSALLICRGDLLCAGVVYLGPGSVLEIDDSLAMEPTIYRFDIVPGNGDGRLQIDGTASNRCAVRANQTGAHTRITDGPYVRGGGRIVASFCDFSRLGGYPDYQAVGYTTRSGAPFMANDCTFDNCGRISASLYDVQDDSHLEFNRCRWINSAVKPDSLLGQWEEWQILQTNSAYGSTYNLIDCDFDQRVFLHLPRDMEVDGCVFRDGILVYKGPWMGGVWRSFQRNLVRWRGTINSFLALEFGNTINDCILVGDDPDGWNPHFMYVSYGTGSTDILDNIFWWTGTALNAEGDGIMIESPSSGGPSENTITIEGNIFLPNGNGPDGDNNLSCTGFTLAWEDLNRQIVFKRNTAFVGAWVGGCNIGETFPTAAGTIAYFKSNLFVGGPDTTGFKLHNLQYAEQDAVLAEDADYNAGYLLDDGSNHGNGSGKGYEELTFSDFQVIGQHDLDDTDPQFVDPYRTVATWSGSLEATMDRLAPGGGHTIDELLEYIREGFRPQNSLLRGAGDPADGSPDIGAVSLEIISAVESSTLKARLSMEPNHPNPFNPSTTISFSIQEHSWVELSIFDLSGRLVAQILNENRSSGKHQVQWQGNDRQGRAVASGLYFCRLRACGECVTAKMVLEK